MVSSIGSNSNTQYNYYNSVIRQLYGNNTANAAAILSGQKNISSYVSQSVANKTQLSNTLRDVRESFNDLKSAAQVLTASNQSSVFKKSDSSAIVSAVQEFADKYNKTVETLQDNKDVLNNKLLKNLTNSANDNKTRLADIGITVNGDKTLTIDKDKLKQAISTNVSTVKTALGSAGGLASKVSKVATNALTQPMAAMVNSNNSVNQRTLHAQYQAQLSQYLNNTYTASFGQLYGIGGLVDTVI